VTTHQPSNDRYATGIRLWNGWTEMWNRRPELARTLVADRFVPHLVTPGTVDPETICDPAAVERWVIAHRARFQRLVFHTGCGPFIDVTAGVVAGPWFADSSLDGAPRPVCGMDTIAFRDGKITEYWTLSKDVDAIGGWVTSRQTPAER
jgi:hypothetical protein